MSSIGDIMCRIINIIALFVYNYTIYSKSTTKQHCCYFEEFDPNKRYNKVSLREKIDLCNDHYSLLKKEKNENLCLNLTKKHYSWYLKGFPNAAYWRTAFMKCKSINEFDSILNDMNKDVL